MTSDKNSPDIHSPIITSAHKADNVAPLLTFVDLLKSSTAHDIAEAESNRLKPYFAAMSIYLTKAINTNQDIEYSDREKEVAKKLTTPGALSKIFNGMAHFSKNTIISEVAILPSGIKTHPETQALFSKKQFDSSFMHNERAINFGFLQIPCKNNTSISFPTYMLDQTMLDAVHDHEPEKLLAPLQKVMTIINHDALHHFTIPVINGTVVSKYDMMLQSNTVYIHAWSRKYAPAHIYEDWAHLGHEKTLLDQDNADIITDVKAQLDDYFAQLKKIGADAASKTMIHPVIDYFGMAMAHAVSRVFPLNHPLMKHTLQLLKEADPAPEDSFDDISVVFNAKEHAQSDLVQTFLQTLSKSEKSIVKSYRTAGLELAEPNDALSPYEQLKLLQLIKISWQDVMPHVPTPATQVMAKLRHHSDRNMLRMIEAAANTVDYEAKLDPETEARLDQTETTFEKLKNAVAKFSKVLG